MDRDEVYMHRCLQLAAMGRGDVAPNPLVGAVLVYENRIIGEGYHRQYGGPHAEVECVNSVSPDDLQYISKSRLYVNLEPCSHFGKTPPCADLILEKNIKEVVIGCRDLFPKVNGSGIQKLKEAGVEVKENVLEEECRKLNRRFFLFHTEHRPFIILKWAATADGRISGEGGSPLSISSSLTNRLVHKWRGDEAAIMIGKNTALSDNPRLTSRLYPGKNPIRILLDPHLEVPSSFQVFDDEAPTIVFNLVKHSIEKGYKFSSDSKGIFYYQISEDTKAVYQVVNGLYSLGIQSMIVEGGAILLQSFIDAALWDEARIIRSSIVHSPNGLAAPALNLFINKESFFSDTDQVQIFERSTIKL